MEHRIDGDTLVLTGSLDVRCTAELRAALYDLLERQTGDLHVDITDVESVDLTTLKLIAVANRAAERHGHRVVLRGGTPAVRRLLHLSHLRSMIPVEPAQPQLPAQVAAQVSAHQAPQRTQRAAV